MYTLENHLTRLAVENPQYNILLSIWNLNKISIPLAQANIVINFPHYSLHEKSHSDTIVKNIESFLGEDRIKTLSPTDTWLILMSAYTHDLGMVVFHKALEEKWIEEGFQDYLDFTSKSSRDVDLIRAANLLLEIQNNITTKDKIDKKWVRPLEIRKATILIISDYFRRIHHHRSREVIVGADKEFNRLMSNFNMDQIPTRFSTILGEIAYAHGIDFYSVIDKLEYEANGYGSDKMHPRFIAFLLRLGDLLDVDDKRFNPFSEKVFTDNLPKLSTLHKEKHASTKHFLVRPDKIEITIDCESDEVYRVAREWFDWLQKEVEDQSREWSNIAPDNLTGLPPSISRGKLKVLFKNALPKPELMNLRFAISNEKIFEMLEGAAIYEYPGFVFLREIVQNAVDATKIQIWKDILNGNHDVTLKTHLKIIEEADTDTIVKKIKYPEDIPNSIYKNYQIDLNIYWDKTNEAILIFDITDKGTGISEANIIRMTSRVGESRSRDKAFVVFKRSMPYWLKPTGAFGIGLQSIFIVANEYVIHTKSENENAKEIRFVSSKRGEYSRVTSTVPEISRGTRLLIRIPKETFPDIFGRGFEYTLIDHWDYFTEELGSSYILKIMHYIRENFKAVKLLNVNIARSKNFLSSPYRTSNYPLTSFLGKAEDEKFKVVLESKMSSEEFRFVIDERFDGSGSRVTIYFPTQFRINRLRPLFNSKKVYTIRDIPVSEEWPSYYRTNYFGLKWNLLNPDSEKVLNISRDKMIIEVREKLEKIMLEKILPASLPTILDLFEKNYISLNITMEERAICYFFLELTCAMFPIKLNHLAEIYSQYTLPQNTVTYGDSTEVKLLEFIKADEFIETRNAGIFFNNENGLLNERWAQEKSRIPFLSDKSIISWNDDDFEAYSFMSKFKIINFQYLKMGHNDRLVFKKYSKKKLSNSIIEVDDYTRQKLLKELFNVTSLNRNIILGIAPYSSVVLKSVDYDEFTIGIKSAMSNIISPINDWTLLDKLRKMLADELESSNNILAKEKIKTYLTEQLPVKLLNWIKEHSILSSSQLVTDEAIYEDYSQMLLDYFSLPEDLN